MKEIITTIIALFLSYSLGSIPSGLWLGLWFRGIDIRHYGSKNIGATNTLRVLGKRMGAIALGADVLKGVIAVIFLSRFSSWEYAPLLCGVAAILGHTASLFLKFKGGKGVATSAGVFLTLCPVPTLIAASVFLLAVVWSRMVSLGSCLSAVVMTFLVYLLPFEWITAPFDLLPEPWTLRLGVSAITLLILVRHKENISRILHGQENRL